MGGIGLCIDGVWAAGLGGEMAFFGCMGLGLGSLGKRDLGGGVMAFGGMGA